MSMIQRYPDHIGEFGIDIRIDKVGKGGDVLIKDDAAIVSNIIFKGSLQYDKCGLEAKPCHLRTHSIQLRCKLFKTVDPYATCGISKYYTLYYKILSIKTTIIFSYNNKLKNGTVYIHIPVVLHYRYFARFVMSSLDVYPMPNSLSKFSRRSNTFGTHDIMVGFLIICGMKYSYLGCYKSGE